MTEITTIVDKKLSMQLDSVSWNKKHDLLAVGAYMIDPKESTKRIGKIFLLQLRDGESSQEKAAEATQLQEVDGSGVLDLKWESGEELRLAVATSSSLELYELDEGRKNVILLERLQLNSMALFLQWMNPLGLLFSDSEGVVHLVDLNPLRLQRSRKLHESLTWVVQYSADNKLVFAGADNGAFTGFNLDNIEDESKHFLKKFHVGVTSILFLPNDLLAVGSYDDTLKFFSVLLDTETETIYLTLKKKIEFGGAVWRTLYLPSRSLYSSQADAEDEAAYCITIVAACARDGIHLLKFNCKTLSYEKVTSCLCYEGFLAYGVDAKVNSTHDSNTYTIASCYFDNQQLHVWKTSE